jgi:hypothetical protein
MDPSQFDTVLCAFTLSRSRRGLSSALAGLVLGGALGSVALEAGEAKKKKKKPDCKKGKKRCGKYCISKDLCCTNKDCPGCGVCKSDGKCYDAVPIDIPDLCPPCLSLRCNTATNEWDCMACDARIDEVCCNGSCQPATQICCPAGEEKCPQGEFACCDDLDRCIKDGSGCCAPGLEACEHSCAKPGFCSPA